MEKSLRIIFIEDNIYDAELIWKQLKREKIHFIKDLVESRSLFEEALKTFDPDLIISDFSLPHFDGMEALAIRNEISPDVPFILVTGSINEEIAVKCMKSGADDYILKDSLSRLGEAVKSALKKKEIIKKKEIAEKLLLESVETVKRSQKEFRNYFESGAIGMSVTGPDKKWIQVNEKLCRMFGYEREELMTMTWMDITIPEDLGENLRLFDKAIAGEIDNYELDKRFKRKNGELIHINLYVVCQRNPDGTVHHFLSSYIDITDRVRYEEQIRQQRIMLRTLIDHLPSPVYILDNFGRKVIANKADLENIGVENEADAIGKSDVELFPGEIGIRGHRDNMLVIETGNPIVDREEVFFNKKNEKKYLLTTKVPLIDTKNSISGLVGIGYDITERKRMEEIILESETYYRTLVDLSPDGIFISDMEGTITYFSKKIYDIFGIPDDGTTIIGSSILDWVSPDYYETVLSRFKEILEGNVTYTIKEYKLLKYDRTPFWAELSSSPVKYWKKGLLVICRDITERKNVADELLAAKVKAEESDKLKTAFLHNISHEIRTPMNAIVGFSELIASPGLDIPTIISYIEIIKNSSNHLLAIINDIIDISNIEANIVKINKQKINLETFLSSIHDQFSIKAVEKKLDLIYRNEVPYEDLEIITDSTKLQQVISNLLSNAIKFTANGSIYFGCKKEGSYLRFYVRDTGIGIPEEHQQKIFERFYQVGSSLSKVYEGTGLGLAISKAYVEIMKGEMKLNSAPGKGSEFIFTLPYEKRPEPVPEAVILPDPGLYFGPTKRILVAEDVDSNYKLIQFLLKGSGAELIRVENGKDAVDVALSDNNIDLILMDVKMPVMDGFTATRIIRDARPVLPIIIQTAYADDSDKAIESGSSAFLVKPFDRKKLLEIISKYI